jgi:hypothetical protein
VATACPLTAAALRRHSDLCFASRPTNFFADRPDKDAQLVAELPRELPAARLLPCRNAAKAIPLPSEEGAGLAPSVPTPLAAVSPPAVSTEATRRRNPVEERKEVAAGKARDGGDIGDADGAVASAFASRALCTRWWRERLRR